MGAIYEEFQREMASLRQRFATQPRRELIRLLLLALEREEIVSIGYRESVIMRRLQSMPIDDGVRELIRHALVWIWKDEEMHTIYVRGAILKLGSRRLRLQAFLTQAAGGIGGWASSVMQHTRWSQAPLSRALAGMATAVGRLLGKVPADVGEHLNHGPFRNFCRFNIDAEQTAAVCWQRLVELAVAEPGLGPRAIDDFRRVVDDERRHERIFKILADALDDQDRLRRGETIDSLAEQIAEVGPFFLPRFLRGVQDIENPIGSGGRVWSFRGAESDDKRSVFRQLLEQAGLPQRLKARARFVGKPIQAMRVAIKPSFMLGYHRGDLSPITDPDLLRELARFLRETGVEDVAVVEGSNIYDHFYDNRSVAQVAEYFGLCSKHYRVVDASQEQIPHRFDRGMGQYSVARTWKEADLRISFSKLRSHPIELALLSLANVEWLGGRCDQFLFVERQAQRETAIMMLLDEFPPHFAIVEGYDTAPDGLVGMMGCRRPKALRRLYAGGDALAVDMLVARHLGVRSTNESSILRTANHWFGGWVEDLEVVGHDEPVRHWRGPYSTEISSLLSFLAYPVYQFASGRGALFTPEMDESAFPSLRRPSLLLRAGRFGVRSLLGLRGAARKSAQV